MQRMVGSFYEIFAGAGMARAGLGERWRCVFANDFSQKKAVSYRRNWGSEHFLCADVRKVTIDDMTEYADLVWASFPCQDLSLAGNGNGLMGDRSRAFWPFWNLMRELDRESRSPNIVVLENVCGTLTSHGGKDFVEICNALCNGGYRVGALIINAVLFIPQSRPRLFIVAVHKDVALPKTLLNDHPNDEFHPGTLVNTFNKLPRLLQDNWVWWQLATPPKRKIGFSDVMEEHPSDVSWHSTAETQKLLGMMSRINLNKVHLAMQDGRRVVGTVYKRMRRDEAGRSVQKAEVRFDNIAGCLRTPTGGSSRQIIIIVEGNELRSRLISSRETARLMGLSDEYILPDNYNEAYLLMGDGVVVPVVRYLADEIIEPILLHTTEIQEVG